MACHRVASSHRLPGLKILLLKPSSLGDVVHALPVLRLLRRHLPAARIDWWIDSRLAGLLEGDPHLTHLIRFERERWSRPRHWPEALRSLRDIRRTRYDWVIDLQALARSAAVAWFAGAELTIGLEDLREGAATFYDLRIPRPTPRTHAVDWYLATLRALDIPVDGDFDWMPPRPEVAAGLEARWPGASATWVGIQPGARWDTKRWPPTAFGDLIRELSHRHTDLRFAVFGSAGEQALAGEVCARGGDRCLNLAGQLSLAQMVEWLRRCRLLVSNDTGPMHVAAALGKPVVALFGPTDPLRTGPYGQQHLVLQERLPCVPCFRGHCTHPTPLACLHALTVGRVAQEVERRLGRGS